LEPTTRRIQTSRLRLDERTSLASAVRAREESRITPLAQFQGSIPHSRNSR
jgi:hypothetical protein